MEKIHVKPHNYGIQNYKAPKKNKRKLILDESFEMIQKEGLEKFSMKRLCKKLDMAQSGIFYYFKNMDTLFSELIKQQVFNETNFLLAQVQITKKPKRAVKRYFFYFIEYYLSRPELFKLVYQNLSFQNFSDETKEVIEAQQADIFAYLGHHCKGHYHEHKYDFMLYLKSLKLQAQSLVTYYYNQASKEAQENFELLCKESWKTSSKSVFIN